MCTCIIAASNEDAPIEYSLSFAELTTVCDAYSYRYKFGCIIKVLTIADVFEHFAQNKVSSATPLMTYDLCLEHFVLELVSRARGDVPREYNLRRII